MQRYCILQFCYLKITRYFRITKNIITMADQLLTVAQYAKKRGVSKVAVTRALNKGKQLIGVQSAQKLGRDWFLTVCNPVSKRNIGKCVVIQE